MCIRDSFCSDRDGYRDDDRDGDHDGHRDGHRDDDRDGDRGSDGDSDGERHGDGDSDEDGDRYEYADFLCVRTRHMSEAAMLAHTTYKRRRRPRGEVVDHGAGIASSSACQVEIPAKWLGTKCDPC